MTDEITVSNSQIKTFRRCRKAWAYKYIEKLEPKEKKRAPYLGNWIHRCLETYYKEGDWKIGHNEYLKQWDSLFEEEREELSKKNGPLPDAVKRILFSYLWYWKHDGWKVLDVEYEFDLVVGSFSYKGVKVVVHVTGYVDLVVEDEQDDTRWVIDHKTTGNIPEQNAFHAMDPQLLIYPVAVAKKHGSITGVQYNYIRSRPASQPQITKAGKISRRKIVTDYPTVVRFLKKEGFNPKDFSDFLRPLKKSSPLMKRYRLPREPVVTKKILEDVIRTSRDIYAEREQTEHVRTITASCKMLCEFHDICRGELNGYDMTHLKKAHFQIRTREKPRGDKFDEE